MKVKRLQLQNYGRFEDLGINFAPTAEKTSNVTVIVGNNGAGKSQILQALATSLSWFVARLSDDNRDGEELTQSIIKNDNYMSSVQIIIEDLIYVEKNEKWSEKNIQANWKIDVTREKKLRPATHGLNINNFSNVTKSYIHKFNLNQEASLPVLAYYPVERAIRNTPVEISDNFVNNQFTAYDDALEKSVNFESFFSWFREQEDIENEIKLKDSAYDSEDIQIKAIRIMEEMNYLHENINNNLNEEEHSNTQSRYQKYLLEIEDFQKIIESKKKRLEPKLERLLTPIRKSINRFTGFENIRIRRQGTPTMIVEKEGEELDVNQLSQGEKSLLALVGDIARRLALLNPSLNNPLEGEGVVMIDEVDLHLHPKWQHDLIDKLVKTFPNVQFILTTHSPHVISDRNDILLYSLDDGELFEKPNVYGEDANTVLTKIFDVDIRDSKVEKQFTVIRRAISKHDYMTAESNIVELAEKLPSDHLELLKCRLLLAQAKLNDEGDKPSYAED
ncbi:AAA family ATPase [Psychrobacter sp. TAE2020]|uniref:AAA family ATPase n=1 Tax=Psychrobacter sp. TAE2020 TaxID=2846762 RepID=UPI001C1084A3|nr:AAA family ATPase [Psychrobacter sp. TAE2020]MBU5617382.1 AAA family ATPase [Psychrobacter sp. TAE2020]